MSAVLASDRLEFSPPPTPGALRSFGLAVLAHLFLVAALTWGMQWHSETVTITAEAELWSAVPQQAAPRLVEVAPEPPAPPPPPVAAPVEAPKPAEVDIALEREKLRLKKEKLEKLALEKQQLKNEKLERDRLRQKEEKLALEKKRLQEKQAALEKQKLAQEKQRKDAQQAQQDAKRLDALRQENLKRMAGLAGASGAQGSTGTALKSSGPSASYAGRIRASIKPNIVFAESVSGNPKAEVEVRTAPDGSIIGHKLLQSSGIKSWDEAVLKALDKVGTLPRDVDGRVPPSLIITFTPKD
jgi:colicin import membrane protein